MKAREIMNSPVLATTPRASVRDIAAKLLTNRISGMPVADRGGMALGVITEADILGAMIEGRKLETLVAEDIMCSDPVTVDVEASITEVTQVLNEEGILRVPVTDHGKLVGIITRSDIIKAVLEPEFLSFE